VTRSPHRGHPDPEEPRWIPRRDDPHDVIVTLDKGPGLGAQSLQRFGQLLRRLQRRVLRYKR
jgi:hypothetical protein